MLPSLIHDRHIAKDRDKPQASPYQSAPTLHPTEPLTQLFESLSLCRTICKSTTTLVVPESSRLHCDIRHAGSLPIRANCATRWPLTASGLNLYSQSFLLICHYLTTELCNAPYSAFGGAQPHGMAAKPPFITSLSLIGHEPSMPTKA